MRRCRKEEDSFAFLKRKPSVINRNLPPISKCKTLREKLLGLELGNRNKYCLQLSLKDRTDISRLWVPVLIPKVKKKETSVCSVDTSAPCCNDPECTCPEKVLLEQLRSRTSPLFCTVAQQGIPDIQKSPFTPEMLISGFGLRNLSSLQQALYVQGVFDKESVEEENYESITTDLDKSTSSQTEITLSSTVSTTEEFIRRKKKLEYFMGITTTEEEEEGLEELQEEPLQYVKFGEVTSEELYTGETESMRQAQRYLRTHRIFEFFQFLIAHLLSAIPDNPIEFLMELLEKCLIYRSGVGEPPLLYRRPHLDQLFFLMDRMRTGVIDLNQYVAGMKTLGICNYQTNPPTNKDGVVTREYFIHEAYSKLTEQFSDLVKKHYLKFSRPSLSQPPPTPQPTSKTWTSQLAFIESGVEEESEKVDEQLKLIEICKARRKVEPE